MIRLLIALTSISLFAVTPCIARPDTKSDLEKKAQEEFLATKAKAENGDVDAQYQLAKLYKAGKGTKKSDIEAVKWYRAVAAQKDARGQSMLGVMYTNGLGVKIDYDVAIKWFLKAAAQNSAHAKYNLGYMYSVGKGVTRDQAMSTEWFRQASELNDTGSQRILGRRYVTGQGVEKNVVLAYAWTAVAIKRGGLPAKKQLESIVAKMTPEQIAEAKQMAKTISARIAKLEKK
jgi:uncharacterized protein